MNVACGIVERIVVKIVKYVFSFMYKDRDAIWISVHWTVCIMLLLWNCLGTGAFHLSNKKCFIPSPLHNIYYKITFWKLQLWLAKSRLSNSITVWKTWKNSRHYTPSWTVWRIYALVKKTISTFRMVFDMGYFIKEIENIFSRVYIQL